MKLGGGEGERKEGRRGGKEARRSKGERKRMKERKRKWSNMKGSRKEGWKEVKAED